MRRTVRRFWTAILTVALLSLGAPATPVFGLIAGGYYPIAMWPDNAGSYAAPSAIAVAPAGEIYVADTDNCRVKRLASDGTVIDVWGSRGTGNGEFDAPAGIAVVPSTGRVIVADTGNDRLQVFEADGTFVAVWGSSGTGQGQFNTPAGLALDSSGNVFVADSGNSRVQKLSSAGSWLATIGSPGVGNGQLDGCRGVAVSSTRIFVADTNNHRIQAYTTAGVFVTYWGPEDVGGGVTMSRYNTPQSIALAADGDLFVVDSGGIRQPPTSGATYFVEKCSTTDMYAPTGIHARWGTPGSGIGQFAGPRGLAARPGGGVYVADAGNDRIQELDATGAAIAAWSGSSAAAGEFDGPQGVAFDASNRVWVADTRNDRVQLFDGNGFYLAGWGSSGSGIGQIDEPTDIAVSPTTGNIWVVEKANGRAQSFTPAGAPVSVVGAGQVSNPEGIALDSSGNIYIADTGGARVVKFSSAGTLLATFGTTSPDLLSAPTDVALDGSGNLYVTDRTAGKVQVYSSSGAYVRTIGAAGPPGGLPGTLFYPTGLAVTGSSVLVADTGNHRVQRFSVTGTLESVFGSFGAGLGEFSWPVRVAVDSNGKTIVVERDNHRVQIWSYDGTPPVSTISGFINNNTYSAPVTATITPTDAGIGVAATYYTVDGGALQTYSVPFRIDKQGETVIRYRSVDFMGNSETTRTARVRIDSLPPAGTFVLQAGAAYVASTTVTADSAFTDAIDMRFNTGSGYGGLVGYQDVYPLVLPGEGLRQVSAQYRDVWGNTSTYEDTITVDLTGPDVGATGVPGGWVAVPPQISLSATDTASGVDAIFYRLDADGPFEYADPFEADLEGETELTYWAVDNVGNAGPVESATIRLDTTAPSGSFALNGGDTYVTTTTVSANSSFADAVDMAFDTGGGYAGWLDYADTASLVLSAEGTRTVSARYRDFLGNTSTYVDTITVDLTGPTTTANGIPWIWTATPVTVSLSASDTVSAVEHTYYRIEDSEPVTYTAPFEIAQEGTTTVTFWSVDAAGNAGPTGSRDVRIDTSVPSGTMMLDSGSAYTTTSTVSVQSSVTGATRMRVDTGAGFGVWQPYAETVEVTLAQGVRTVNVEYRDEIDDVDRLLPLSDSITVDWTVPDTVMSGVPGGWSTEPLTLSLDSLDDVSGVAHIYYRLEGSDPVTYTAPFEYDVQGETAIEFWAIDRAGNLEAADSVTAFVDLASPETTISGVPDDWSTEPLTIGLDASDAVSGVAHSYYRVGDSDPVTYTAPFEFDTQGETAIEFWSVDVAGNAEEPGSITARIDLDAPTTTIHGVPVVYSPDAVTLSLTAADPVSGLDAIYYRLDTGDVATYDGPFTIDTEGTTRVTYWAADEAGNVEGERFADVVLDFAPAAPGEPGAVGVGRDWIDLEWAAHGESDVTGYTLWIGSPGSSDWEAVQLDVSVTSYRATGLTPGAEYLFKLTVRDRVGNESAASPETRVTAGVADTRVYGATRYETALAISRATFVSAPVAILATGENFADALGASSLAGALGAPVLITYPDRLPAGLAQELDRLGVERVVLVGGERAISRAVEAEISAAYPVERIAGITRYETAALVASQTLDVRTDVPLPESVFVVRGDEFADALAAAPVAYSGKIPVLLVRPDAIPPGTAEALEAGGYTNAIVLGGSRAVSDEVAVGLGMPYVRHSGATRYDTAAEFANWALEQDLAEPSRVGLATGVAFPDALAGGASMGALRGVVLLTASGELSAPASAWLDEHEQTLQSVTVFGGERAVSSAVLEAVRQVLQ